MEKKFLDAYKMVKSHEGTLFVYAFSYSLITGIAPFLIIAVVIASTFLLDVNAMIDMISHFIPADLIEPFISYVKDSNFSDFILLVSLSSVSFWVASKSVYSFLLESSRIDEIKIRSIVLRAISVLYFLIIIVGGLSVMVLLNYLPPYNYITVPLLLWLMMMSFYRLISFRFSSFSDVYMGSALATSGLIVLGKIFFIYINDYSNYRTIYGPLSSLMILLISCYFISLVVYYGFCVNVVFYKKDQPESQKRKLVYSLSQFSLRKTYRKLMGKDKLEEDRAD